MHEDELLIKYFKLVNPQIDIESNDYKNNLSDLLLEQATQLTEDNYKYIVYICNRYLMETKESKCSSKENYNVFLGMLNTIYMLIKYGGDSLYKEIYSEDYDENNILTILDKVEVLLNITDLFFNKELHESFIRYTLVESYYIALYGGNVAINYLKKYLDSPTEIFYEVFERLKYIDSILVNQISLLFIFDGYEDLDEVLEKQLAERTTTLDRKALADLNAFSYCIKKGDVWLENYISYYSGNEHKHWYNLVEKFIQTNDEVVITNMNIVGKYLCETFDELSTKRFLYHSIFYENIALEYAYKNNLNDIAEKIIYNGYDYYLELSTLYIIRKYDYNRFLNEIKKLKYICLVRNIEGTGYKVSFLKDLYGEEFCKEYNELARLSLKGIDMNDLADPRLSNNRVTPEWAK